MKKFKVSLDTGLINRKPFPEVDKINSWFQKGLLEIEYADAFDADVVKGSRNAIEGLPEKEKEAALERTVKAEEYQKNSGPMILGSPTLGKLGVNHLGAEPREDLVKQILFGKNYKKEKHYLDVRHLSIHDSRNNDFFITLDNDFLLKKKELAKIGIFVISPSGFVFLFKDFFN
ncbi:MAG: hypothetical protein J7J51_00240 [Candidatus Omnitrophica bacterium]|nr:hypothetical protein [Candidatus Omnitrophota bacterium]